MLLSSSFLSNAFTRYKNHKKYKENFSADSAIKGINDSFITFLLFIAVIFFILELLVLFYSIMIAVKCTAPGPERIVHIVLAVFFTLPYALINVIFSNCSKNVLRGGNASNPIINNIAGYGDGKYHYGYN